MCPYNGTGTIFFAANFCFWPVIGSAFAQTWDQLLTTRLLMGIGMGAKASCGKAAPSRTRNEHNIAATDDETVPIFAAENSPAAIRGALVMSWRMWNPPPRIPLPECVPDP